MKNPYSVLGVSKSASQEEIKKAYRKLTMKHHPDKGGDEKKFHEVQNAYDVLSNPTKKQSYDRWGTTAPSGGFADFSSGRGAAWDDDIFSRVKEAFGGFGFSFDGFEARNTRPRPRKGKDIRRTVTITLEDLLKGSEIEIVYKRVVASTTYPGKFEETTEKQKIKIEPEIKTDATTIMRAKGKGSDGWNGGPSGDLYIHINVKKHNEFDTKDRDLFCTLKIDWIKCILGSEESIKGLNSESYKIKIPPGTQPGNLIRIQGAGLPRPGNVPSRGDIVVRVLPIFDEPINDQSKNLLEELQNKKRKIGSVQEK